MELRRYWEIIWRRKWVFIQAVGVIALVTLASIILMDPIYKATTYVRIDVQDIAVEFFSPGSGGIGSASQASLPSNLGKVTLSPPEHVLGTFKAMIENKENVGKVIQKLNLKQEKKDEFIEVKDFINPDFFNLILQGKGVQISEISNSELIEISGYSKSTDESVNIADKVADAFIAFLKDTNRQKILQVYNSIEREVLKIEKDLAKAEKDLENFRKENQVINLDDQRKTLMSQKVMLENKLYETQRFLMESESTLISIKKALSIQSDTRVGTTTIEDNPLLVGYKDSLLNLQLSLAKALTEMSSEHPKVKEIQNQIETIKGEINKEVVKTFASEVTTTNPQHDSLVKKLIETEINTVTLDTGEAVLSEQIEVLLEELNEIPSKELKLDQHARKVNALKVTYSILLGQLEMARIAKDMDIANATIIEAAAIPVENFKNYVYFPKKVMMMVLSLFLGGGFALFLVFLFEYLDDSFRFREEIEDGLNYPVISMIPRISKKCFTLSEGRDEEAVRLVDLFLDLRSNIRSSTLEEKPRIISVVSAEKNEGKTTISNYLANIYSKGGDRVLLIDCNLRGHSVPKNPDALTNVGLSNLLQSQEGLEDAIQVKKEKLDVIPCGPIVHNPLIFLESDGMANIIKQLKERYDLVIIDTSAIEEGNDAIAVSRYCDKALFVIASGESSRKKVKIAVDLLQSSNVPILGFVLNKTIFDGKRRL